MARKSAASSSTHLNRNTLRDQKSDVDSAPPVCVDSSSINATLTTGCEYTASTTNFAASSPKTPQRATPNSTRKRRPAPDLSRSSASSSHGEKISMIFRDASAALQGFRTPPRRPTSNIKLSRRTPFQAHSKEVGSAGQSTHIELTEPETHSQAYNCHDLPSEATERSRNVHPDLGSCLSREDATHCTANNAVSLCTSPTPELSKCLPRLLDQTSSSPLANTPNESNVLDVGNGVKEPISSGFTTPSALYSQPPKTPDEVSYPEFAHWTLPPSSSVRIPRHGSRSEGAVLRSSSPSALPVSSPDPEKARLSLEIWLNGIRGSISEGSSAPDQWQDCSTSHQATKKVELSSSVIMSKPHTPKDQDARSQLGPSPRTPSKASSNKENISPSRSTSSLNRSSIPNRTSTPPRNPVPSSRVATSPTEPLHFPDPLTPQGHLCLPPRRKKTRVALQSNSEPSKSGKDFTIHEDQVVNALAQLSPDVELRRKGRRPKKERCISYWDEDILTPSSPYVSTDAAMGNTPLKEGRQVLGESQQSAQLTKETPFIAEAEGAAFEFSSPISRILKARQ